MARQDKSRNGLSMTRGRTLESSGEHIIKKKWESQALHASLPHPCAHPIPSKQAMASDVPPLCVVDGGTLLWLIKSEQKLM